MGREYCRHIADSSGGTTYLTASFTTRIFCSAMGREYYRHRDDGSGATTYLTATTTNCPAGTAYKALKTSADGSASQECFDVLGRTTRTLTRGFNGQWKAQDTEYDEFDRVKRKSEPYDLGTGAQYWTTFHYDLLGRVRRTDLPDGSFDTIEYRGLTTTKTAHTNVGSQSKTEVRNAAGELLQVSDNLGGVTAYGYDDQGNPTRVTDNAGNVSAMGYDLLGRKIAMSDPDKGAWEYDHRTGRATAGWTRAVAAPPRPGAGVARGDRPCIRSVHYLFFYFWCRAVPTRRAEHS